MPYKEGARGVKGLYKERSPTQAGAQPLIRAMPLSSATTDLPAKGTRRGGGVLKDAMSKETGGAAVTSGKLLG